MYERIELWSIPYRDIGNRGPAVVEGQVNVTPQAAPHNHEAKMKTLSKTDDAPKRAFSCDGRNVNVTATIKPNKDSPVRFSFENVAIRFDDVDESEILELAGRTVWINGMQRPFRGVDDDGRIALAFAWEADGFSVREWLDRERKHSPIDPVKAIAKALPKMTEAKKNELRALLGE